MKSLKKLKLRYKLIDVDFFHAKNAFITMLSIDNQGQSFTIPTNRLINNKDLSMRLKFFLLVGAYVKTEGEDIGSLTNKGLGRRFGISEIVFRRARKELG